MFVVVLSSIGPTVNRLLPIVAVVGSKTKDSSGSATEESAEESSSISIEVAEVSDSVVPVDSVVSLELGLEASDDVVSGDSSAGDSSKSLSSSLSSSVERDSELVSCDADVL